jgi:hypothetical protein
MNFVPPSRPQVLDVVNSQSYEYLSSVGHSLSFCQVQSHCLLTRQGSILSLTDRVLPCLVSVQIHSCKSIGHGFEISASAQENDTTSSSGLFMSRMCVDPFTMAAHVVPPQKNQLETQLCYPFCISSIVLSIISTPFRIHADVDTTLSS